MNTIRYIIVCFLILVSCSNEEETASTLSAYTQGRITEIGAVIACAASDGVNNDILTFYYPETGATDIRFYQTNDVNVDHSNFSNYSRTLLNSSPFFNGYLGKFTQAFDNEKWVIVTFELEGEIKISNPIRTKQISKPTIWMDDVDIDQNESGMPHFTWIDDVVGDNAIYFQVISDAQNNLLSGTYTFENHFQYYNIDNVVLNITTQTPPDLTLNANYNFTLMDVSEDNWVNLVINKKFIAQ
ncbi:hypothetical protein [Flavivirga algicola]|uniref:NigD-like C-terminal beta sandwich domain-containing protein n=1 Tax=Flavivirga algicola TaxID=2729136 RepID=A0ABX1RUQ7_9FLAO|nr:hypothetical protein [Flavivirga algicola]NMH87285.1 hypothetical protein [Flavivirga algicola]